MAGYAWRRKTSGRKPGATRLEAHCPERNLSRLLGFGARMPGLIEQIVARLCRQSQHPLRIDVYQRSSPHDPRVQRALSLSSSSGPRGIEGRTNKMPVSATRLSTYPLLGFVRRTWSYPHQLIGHRRVLLLGRLVSSELENHTVAGFVDGLCFYTLTRTQP